MDMSLIVESPSLFAFSSTFTPFFSKKPTSPSTDTAPRPESVSVGFQESGRTNETTGVRSGNLNVSANTVGLKKERKQKENDNILIFLENISHASELQFEQSFNAHSPQM